MNCGSAAFTTESQTLHKHRLSPLPLEPFLCLNKEHLKSLKLLLLRLSLRYSPSGHLQALDKLLDLPDLHIAIGGSFLERHLAASAGLAYFWL